MACSRRSLEASSVKMLKPQDSNLFSCPVDSPKSCSSKTSECSSNQSSELNIANHFVTQDEYISNISQSEMTGSLSDLKQEVDLNIPKEELSLSYSLTPLSEDAQSNKNVCFNSGSSSDSQSCAEKQTRRKSEGCKRKSTEEINAPASSKKLCLESKPDKAISSTVNSTFKSFSETSTVKEKDLLRCGWLDCVQEVPFSELLDHLLTTHIKSQQPKKRSIKEQLKFACRWVGCKVFNKPSTLLSWLEKHVICHLGNKPYRCIVDNCGLRFTSQCMLNRHINRHFNSTLPPAKKGDANGGRLQKTGSLGKNGKVSKRKVRKMISRSAEGSDVFDSPTMNCMQQCIVNLASHLSPHSTGLLVTLSSRVIGERTAKNKEISFLIRWFPPNCLPDEWVPEANLPSKQSIHLPFTSLPCSIIHKLMTVK